MKPYCTLDRPNTLVGARKNIEEHYDVGNDMYSLFLDPSMTYSCGIHSPGAPYLPNIYIYIHIHIYVFV